MHVRTMKTQPFLAIILVVFLTLAAVAEDRLVVGDAWVIDTQTEWQKNTTKHSGLEIKDGMASPTTERAVLASALKTFESKRAAKSIVIEQSPEWLNWEQTDDLGPVNLGDAPVMLRVGPDNYWMFGRYGSGRKRGDKSPLPPFKPQPAKLDGFDIPLQTTRFPNQFDAPGGLKPRLGGYHAWQSKDMVNWVHHGPITEKFSAWMTTAEYADGKAYFYYDFPNDQDPHVYVDADMFDGVPGDNKGIAYDDPSHGSDCAIIRDLDGKFPSDCRRLESHQRPDSRLGFPACGARGQSRWNPGFQNARTSGG